MDASFFISIVVNAREARTHLVYMHRCSQLTLHWTQAAERKVTDSNGDMTKINTAWETS